MTMKDWRGYEYPEETLNELCEICGKQAVRNCCVAEDDKDRTHWHGAIHTIDDGLKFLCRECSIKENNKWKK
jgi:hypothetical protein